MGHHIVQLQRLPGRPLGFQFVSDVKGLGAVITFVTPGGLSFGHLIAGDRIQEIDGHDVSHARPSFPSLPLFYFLPGVSVSFPVKEPLGHSIHF